MRFKIKGKKEFKDLSRHIKEDASYNVSIAEVSLMSGGFTDEQRLELAKIVAETIAITVPPLIEKALAPIKQDIVEIKKDIVEIKDRLSNLEKDVAKIKSLPTIQRELKLQKSS